MAAVHLVLKSPSLKHLKMEIQDNLLVYLTSWDRASNRLNLPISGIIEVLGTVYMLSNSDLYPNVWVCEQILAKLNVSAILRRLAANGNLMHLKSVSLFSMIHISRSWLICYLASKGFADALCEWDYIYLPSVQQHEGFLMTDLELWVDLWIARKGCLQSKPLQGVCKSVFFMTAFFFYFTSKINF